MSADPLQLYADLGVRPVINALGARTVLGGSEPHPEVVQAMQLAGRYYVDMDELFIRSGEVIADMIGAPATLVTPGCAAALVLGTAACLTGDDPKKMAQLPDLRGLKDQVIIQRPQRYKYDRVVRMTGVEIVPVGSDTRATEEDVEAAINERPPYSIPRSMHQVRISAWKTSCALRTATACPSSSIRRTESIRSTGCIAMPRWARIYSATEPSILAHPIQRACYAVGKTS